jgi:hypothetical protein
MQVPVDIVRTGKDIPNKTPLTDEVKTFEAGVNITTAFGEARSISNARANISQYCIRKIKL